MTMLQRFLKRQSAVFAAVFSLLASMPAFATTYAFNFPNYTAIGGTGTPPVYTTAMHLTGSFTTASPLPANMPVTGIGPSGSNLVQTWSFNDGLHTYSASNTNTSNSQFMIDFYVSTDSGGNIKDFTIGGFSPLPPNTIGQKMNGFAISTGGTAGVTAGVQAVSNDPCISVDGSGKCTNASFPNADSYASGSFTGTFVTTPAVNGVCGSDNGLTLSAAPTHLCSVGTQSAVTSNGVSWNWTCAGSNGGTTATCSARTATAPPPPAVSAPMLDAKSLALLTALFALIGGIGWWQRRPR